MDTQITSPAGLRNTTPAGPSQLPLTVSHGQLWIEGTGPAPLPLASMPFDDTEGALASVGRWIMAARNAAQAGAR